MKQSIEDLRYGAQTSVLGRLRRAMEAKGCWYGAASWHVWSRTAFACEFCLQLILPTTIALELQWREPQAHFRWHRRIRHLTSRRAVNVSSSAI